MSIEAKKLSFIERFMKLNKENSILKLESILTEIELNTRIDASEADINQGNVRSYEDFNKEVKQWMKSNTISLTFSLVRCLSKR